MTKFEKLIYIVASLYAIGSLYAMARMIKYINRQPVTNIIEVRYVK